MFEITVSTGLVPSGGSEANPSYTSPLVSGGLRTIFLVGSWAYRSITLVSTFIFA